MRLNSFGPKGKRNSMAMLMRKGWPLVDFSKNQKNLSGISSFIYCV
jgi:hypothetical protein